MVRLLLCLGGRAAQQGHISAGCSKQERGCLRLVRAYQA